MGYLVGRCAACEVIIFEPGEKEKCPVCGCEFIEDGDGYVIMADLSDI